METSNQGQEQVVSEAGATALSQQTQLMQQTPQTSQTPDTHQTQQTGEAVPVNVEVKVEGEELKPPKRVTWTKEMDATLFAVLSENQKANQRANNGFKPEVYTKVAEEVSKTAKMTVAVSNVRNRLDLLKRHWSVACSLMGRSGWSFCTVEKKIEADFDVWETEVRANPKSAVVRGRQLYWFDAANELWAGQVATGTHAFSSADNSPPAAFAQTAGARNSPPDTPPGELTPAD